MVDYAVKRLGGKRDTSRITCTGKFISGGFENVGWSKKRGGEPLITPAAWRSCAAFSPWGRRLYKACGAPEPEESRECLTPNTPLEYIDRIKKILAGKREHNRVLLKRRDCNGLYIEYESTI